MAETWQIPEAAQDEVDRRFRSLQGKMPNWMPKGNVSIFKKPSAKAVDYKNILEHAMEYLFKDLLPTRLQQIWFDLTSILKLLLTEVADVEDEDDDGAKEAAQHTRAQMLKLRVTTALCKFEDEFPKSEMSPVFHTLMHVPDSIYKWNSVRNYWAFFNER